MGEAVDVTLGGRSLRLSNLDKLLYPEAGFTKADVVGYYRVVADVLLPHLAGRPPTLVRAPDGAAGEVFFEKRCPRHRPAWVATAVAPDGSPGCLVDGAAALVWVANLAALELHTHQATAADPAHPSAVVLDLDPGAPAGLLDCAAVALDLRDVLDRLGLVCVVKTSGSKGLHLSVPLNDGRTTADHTKRFALALGQLLEARGPDRVTVDMTKAQRPGRVFVDWSQNDRRKTTIAPYSLRIASRPTVSTPLTWDEVADARTDGDPDRLTFEAPEVVERVARLGDLYAANLTTSQRLPELG